MDLEDLKKMTRRREIHFTKVSCVFIVLTDAVEDNNQEQFADTMAVEQRLAASRQNILEEGSKKMNHRFDLNSNRSKSLDTIILQKHLQNDALSNDLVEDKLNGTITVPLNRNDECNVDDDHADGRADLDKGASPAIIENEEKWKKETVGELENVPRSTFDFLLDYITEPNIETPLEGCGQASLIFCRQTTSSAIG
ncbi:hypothetical protein V1478_010434 [Vespula squamosa]|uniref:Uncharacterized protein n=1 Tax=Vespula squamosa TaxID=30214 RepID=A0ABD2AHR5_VESSQ